MAARETARLRVISADISGLQQQVDEALLKGDQVAVGELRVSLQTLERERDRLRAKLLTGAGTSIAPVEPPVTELVTEALEFLSVEADGRTLTDLISMLHGVHVGPTRIAVLRRDDERVVRRILSGSQHRQARTSWVLPALHFDRLVPMRGRYGLSTWEAERRIVGPRSVRRDHLEQVVALVDRTEAAASAPPLRGRLENLLRQRAQTIPGAMDGATLELRRIREAAVAELAIIGQLDDDARSEAAERLRAFGDPAVEYFGTADLRPVGEAGAR